MGFKVTKDFKGSPDGCTVIQFNVGDKMSVEKHGKDLVDLALKEKWIVAEKAAAPKTPEQLKAEAEKKVKDLEVALGKATDKNKPKVQAKLDAAKAELAKLG